MTGEGFRTIPERIRARHQVLIQEQSYRQHLRLLQALWREKKGFPIGHRKSKGQEVALGSRLEMPGAKEHLWNYLTEGIKEVVREELDKPKQPGKLFAKPRIYEDLLSSQPLCFNLFGELKADLDLAGKVLSRLLPERVGLVTGIEFEWSPGRRDERYTGDRSAFDVFVTYKTPGGEPGFLGIEVKYHEDLGQKADETQPRHMRIAEAARVFFLGADKHLKAKPLQQIFRDHLLALSMLQVDADQWAEGAFVFLSPGVNPPCQKAVGRYKDLLADQATFLDWTLEELVAHIRAAGAGAWIDQFEDRYLDFSKVQRLLEG